VSIHHFRHRNRYHFLLDKQFSKEYGMTVPGTTLTDLPRPEVKNEYSAFLERNPVYLRTAQIDEIRSREFSRLAVNGSVYLDYTGSGLYGDSQVREHADILCNSVFGNPHSFNPTSLAATEWVEKTREAVLRFFNAPAEEYTVIFTLNASGALKLIAESFPFTDNSTYLLTFDNHNSVNGIREYARKHRARIVYSPISPPEMRIDEDRLLEHLLNADKGAPNLFAYPAQSNFSGTQHSLEWVRKARKLGWNVILDAAAFVPTNILDLSVWQPDFVPVSFYKIFGYPTGVGCLLARRAALQQLQRPWFSGGTITVASVQGDKYYLGEDETAFEDGTLNFLSLPGVEIGLRFISSIGMSSIHSRVTLLTRWLIEQLTSLKHSNGNPLVRLYGTDTNEMRGGAVTVNFYNKEGKIIDHRFIEREGAKRKISFRTGCFCNPGGGEVALGLSKAELITCFNRSDSHLTLDDFRQCIDEKGSGAVRISTGLVSNFEDVYSFVNFAKIFLQ
jgi:molybdenum cofactor sulfurtransferase